MERHLAQLAIKIDFIQKIVHRSTMVTCNYMQKGTMIALLKSFWSKMKPGNTFTSREMIIHLTV